MQVVLGESEKPTISGVSGTERLYLPEGSIISRYGYKAMYVNSGTLTYAGELSSSGSNLALSSNGSNAIDIILSGTKWQFSANSFLPRYNYNDGDATRRGKFGSSSRRLAELWTESITQTAGSLYLKQPSIGGYLKTDTIQEKDASAGIYLANKVTAASSFTYGDNAYGVATGSAISISTSGSSSGVTVTGLTLTNSKNITNSSSKMTFGKTGKYRIEASLTLTSAGATCNQYGVYIERFNASNVSQELTPVISNRKCSTDAFGVSMSTLMNVATAGDYVVLKVNGDGAAVNVTANTVTFIITKIDE